MKLVPISTACLLLIAAAQATAQNYWIPAEKFADHTRSELEGSLVEDPNFANKQTLILEEGTQVRIMIGVDEGLEDYVDANPDFEVCAIVANAENGQTNTVKVKHNDFSKSQYHTLENENYRTVCSQIAPIDDSNLLASGVKVISPSQGSIKVRGISFRSAKDDVVEESNQPTLAEHELSRALGYLFAGGGVRDDGQALYFRKSSNSVSKHFGSVAAAAFGDALTPAGSRYNVKLDGQTPDDFIANGPAVIADPAAFLTSVIEGEGAVLVGRLIDDPKPSRCNLVKDLVNGLTPQCAADACTDSSCTVPNCAFIANGSKRGKPAKPGGFCGVYLSGKSSDWAELLTSNAFHFVKCDRTPGGECTQNPTGSRPLLEQ